MTETEFLGISHRVKSLGILSKESLFDGLRVQDPGVINFLSEQKFPKNIHLILEQGNHNRLSLHSWLKSTTCHITRLVLSPEIPQSVLQEYLKEFSVELEVLSIGPILLFYTPRKLVTPLYGESEQEEWRVSGTSQESPHKGFPIIENNHGTFMFNVRDQFILTEQSLQEDLSELILRFDFPLGLSGLSLPLIFDFCLKKESAQTLKETYTRTVSKGFFKVNKTDVLFKKLKNSRLQDRGYSFLGPVVDVKKGKHLGILLKNKKHNVVCGTHIKLVSPEGREKEVNIKKMWDANGNELSQIKPDQIFFIPIVGGISVKSLVYMN